MSNPDSILDTVKKAIGVDSRDTTFDVDIIMFINSAFGSLRQLGVGADSGFVISDNTTSWFQYITQFKLLSMVKTYVFMKVKMMFDPPATSFAIEAVDKQIQEFAWRINIVAEEPDLSRSTFVPKIVNLEYAVIVSIDASAGNVFYLTLTDDCTINSPVNGEDGAHITLILTSNGHVVTWGSGWNFGSAGIPSLSARNSDIISAIFKLSDTEWWAGQSTGF